MSNTVLILLAEYEWVYDTSVAWSAAARDTVCTHACTPCRIASHQESTGTLSLNTRHTTTFCQTLSIVHSDCLPVTHSLTISSHTNKRKYRAPRVAVQLRNSLGPRPCKYSGCAFLAEPLRRANVQRKQRIPTIVPLTTAQKGKRRASDLRTRAT